MLLEITCWSVAMVLESAVNPRLTSPYPFRSFVIRRAGPFKYGRNQTCVPIEENSGCAVKIRPLLSASQITRPTLAHFSEPMGFGSPPAIGTSITVEWPPPVALIMPQAIRFPSGDHDGPEVEKPFGCLLTAIVLGCPLPSVFATISAMSS
jgi:hypothetical protein